MQYRFRKAFGLIRASALVLLLGNAAQAAPGDPPLLHAMFQDHAVVQRDQPIRVWGRTRPGESVRSISLAKACVVAPTRPDTGKRNCPPCMRVVRTH